MENEHESEVAHPTVPHRERYRGWLFICPPDSGQVTLNLGDGPDDIPVLHHPDCPPNLIYVIPASEFHRIPPGTYPEGNEFFPCAKVIKLDDGDHQL